jgi:tetratricopeptide (TPR) repeat protein
MGDYITSIGLSGAKKLEIRQHTDDLIYLSRAAGAGRNWLHVKHFVAGGGDADEQYLEELTEDLPWPLAETLPIAGELRGLFTPFQVITRYVDNRRAVVAALRKLTGWGKRLKRVRIEVDGVCELGEGEYDRVRRFVDAQLPPAMRFGSIDRVADRAQVERASDHLSERDSRLPALAAAAIEVLAHAVRHRLPEITVVDDAGAADYVLLDSARADPDDLRIVPQWDPTRDRLRKNSARVREAQFARAISLIEKRRWTEARRIFNDLAGHEFVMTAIFCNAGSCSYELGDGWRAAAELSVSSLWEDRREAADPLALMGWDLHGLGYREFALRCYDAALGIREDADDLGNRARLFMDIGQPKRALPDITRAFELNPEDDDIRTQYARAHKLLKLTPKGASRLRKKR